MSRLISIFIFTIVCLSCNSAYIESELISFEDMPKKSFKELPEKILKGIEYIPLSNDSLKYIFSMPQKILINGERIYVNDFSNRKLYSYSFSGRPEFVLNKRGRANGEYLQISDFDLDSVGNIWILDGQSDKIIQYSNNGDFLFTSELPFEADYIKCLDNDRLMFSLAEWDKSSYSDYHIIITDKYFKHNVSLINKTDDRDPNFQYIPCCGLHNVNNFVYFHKPISDYVYSIDIRDLTHCQYYFDFGNRKVPEPARVNTEDYIDSFEQYSTLSSSIFINKKIIAGGLVDEMQLSSFIVDREDNIKYIQEHEFSDMMFFGISGSKLIYLLRPDASIFPKEMPENIKDHIANDGMVIAILSLELLEKSL